MIHVKLIVVLDIYWSRIADANVFEEMKGFEGKRNLSFIGDPNCRKETHRGGAGIQLQHRSGSNSLQIYSHIMSKTMKITNQAI